MYISMLLTCIKMTTMAMPADATAEAGQEEVVSITNGNESDVTSATPRNKDYVQLNDFKGFQHYFDVEKGDNVKIHMYLERNNPGYPVRVNFQEGNGPIKVVTIWKGEGHKYADLCINCQKPGRHMIWLEGDFDGSGAVYREP